MGGSNFLESRGVKLFRNGSGQSLVGSFSRRALVCALLTSGVMIIARYAAGVSALGSFAVGFGVGVGIETLVPLLVDQSAGRQWKTAVALRFGVMTGLAAGLLISVGIAWGIDRVT